jgi:putative ABC transport system permease protein
LAPRAEEQTVIRTITERFPHLLAIHSGTFADKLLIVRVIHAAVWSISIVGVLSSCLVVMNTMLMAVAERTREIGVLLAIGWSRWRIVRMILAESLVLCAGAGVAGIALAWVLLSGMLWLNLEGMGLWMTGGITWALCAEAIGLSLTLGALGAIYPAWIASRLMPARCLRYEFI